MCDSCVSYVVKRYGEGTIVVFDKYDGKPSTKDTTHVRITKGKQGIAVHFYGRNEAEYEEDRPS